MFLGLVFYFLFCFVSVVGLEVHILFILDDTLDDTDVDFIDFVGQSLKFVVLLVLFVCLLNLWGE